MPHTVTVNPTQIERALAVLADVQEAFRPGTLLWAAERRAIVAALVEAGIVEGGAVHECVGQTLRTAHTYETDGMYAFLPTWTLLLSRVSRLNDTPTPD